MRNRIRNGLLLLLGLILTRGAWEYMNAWLEPKPLWVYQPAGRDPENTSLDVSCLSQDGRWMLLSILDGKTSSTRRYEIVDRQTGQAVTALDTSRIFQEYNHGYIHCAQPFTLAKDCLWWFAHRIEGDEVVIRLKCLPFLTSKQEQVVHHWRFPSKLRGFIRCVETDALHIVFNLRTELEPALHSLNALTQDGLTLLTHYQSVWATTNYSESWRVTKLGDEYQCQKQAHYFQNDMYDSLANAPIIDARGIAYSAWSKLRADNVVTGEELGTFKLPSRDHLHGLDTLCGILLHHRRYFLYLDPVNGNQALVDPQGFMKHPQATFYDYSFLFDKTTHQPVQWPPDMHRDCLVDDVLLNAADHPNQFLHISRIGPAFGYLNKDMRLCFMTRQGNSLQRDRVLEVKQAHGVAYSPDTTQLYVDRHRYRFEQYPMLSRLVMKYPSLQKVVDLLPYHTGSMDVLSADTGHVLFSVPNAYMQFDHSGLSCRTLAHHQLILLRATSPNRFPMQGHALECWQVPFVIPSPWLARGVAIVVLLLYWQLWRRCHRRMLKRDTATA